MLTRLYIVFTEAQWQLTPESAVKFKLIQAFMVVLVLPARMKKMQSKALECYQDFPHYKSMGFFFKRLRAANSVVRSQIEPNFELVRDFIVVLHTCKNEEDPIEN